MSSEKFYLGGDLASRKVHILDVSSDLPPKYNVKFETFLVFIKR